MATTRYGVYKNEKKALNMLTLLLDISAETSSRALQTTDGTGETPLHTLASSDLAVAVPLARKVIEFDSRLLFKENAVGRTPAELARDRFVANEIHEPQLKTWWSDTSVTTLKNKPTSEFVNWKRTDSEPKVLSVVAQMWNLCEDAMAKFEQLPKRRLVSLHEANDVAKRLGEQYIPDRYKFTINQYEEENKEDESDSEVGKGPVAQAQTERRTNRGEDVVSKNTSTWQIAAWMPLKDESKGDGSPSEDMEEEDDE